MESGDSLTLAIFVAMVVIPFTFYYVASLLNPGYVPIIAEEVGHEDKEFDEGATVLQAISPSIFSRRNDL